MRSLKEVDCHPRRERRGSHIITLSPSRHKTILHYDLNTLNSALVGDPSFPGRVETLRKRFGLLVYCCK